MKYADRRVDHFAGTLKLSTIKRRPNSGVHLVIDALYGGRNFNQPPKRVGGVQAG